MNRTLPIAFFHLSGPSRPLLCLVLLAGCACQGIAQPNGQPEIEHSLELRFDPDNSELTGQATLIPGGANLTGR